MVVYSQSLLTNIFLPLKKRQQISELICQTRKTTILVWELKKRQFLPTSLKDNSFCLSYCKLHVLHHDMIYGR